MEFNASFSSPLLPQDIQALPSFDGQQHSNDELSSVACPVVTCQCSPDSRQMLLPPSQQEQPQTVQDIHQLQRGQLSQSFAFHELGYQSLLHAMPTILLNTAHSVETVHGCHAGVGYHSHSNTSEGMSGIVWPQEIKVNGRRRPVGEFQRLQERAALAGSLVSAGDDHAMRRAGLVNNSTVYDGNSSMHGLQTGYQQPESVLRSPIMYDKQSAQEIQSPTSTQYYNQIPSYMYEGRDAVATSAADIAPATGLFPGSDYNLVWSTLNSLLFPVSVESCVPETAEPALSGTMADSTISSSISSPVARYQTVEYAAVPTSNAAQVPLILHNTHESVSKDKNESQGQDTTAHANSNETRSNITIKAKRATCKRRGVGKHNREPNKTSPTFTPHAQAELRKTLRNICSNPFPDAGMVTGLCKRLGLSNRQVRNWFAVHRFRDMFNTEVDGVKEWRFRDNLV